MPQNRIIRPIAPRRCMSNPSLVRLLVIGTVFGCADTGSPTDEIPSSRKPVLVGPRVQRAPDNPRFHADTHLIFQGRRDASSGACVLGHELTLKRGERVSERTIEIDLDTCRYVVERGKSDRPLPSNRHADSLSARSRVKHYRHPHPVRPSSFKRNGSARSLFSNALFSSSMHSTMGPGTSCATQLLWFEDPIGINVTESELHVFWEWEVFEDPSGEIFYADPFHFLQWYGPSGWQLQSDQLQIMDWYPSIWEIKGFSSMDNNSFPCPDPPPTWTHYNPNQLNIYGNGSVGFYYSVFAHGACSNLLTLNREAWQDY